MECHCKDHLPGDWHSHEGCDCQNNDYPTYAFVVTKVIEEVEKGYLLNGRVIRPTRVKISK